MQDKSPQLAVSVSFPPIEPYLNVVQRVADRYAISPVRVLARLADPHVFESRLWALGLFVFFHFSMILQESLPLRIFRAFLYMEGVRDDLKGVFTLELIKSFDVVKHGLFVTYIIVAFKMVVHFQRF